MLDVPVMESTNLDASIYPTFRSPTCYKSILASSSKMSIDAIALAVSFTAKLFKVLKPMSTFKFTRILVETSFKYTFNVRPFCSTTKLFRRF
jgi:hypothetical protein